MTPLTGLVLAGGAGRRMGADKAALVLEGRTLLERAVATLVPVTEHVLVASGDGRRLPGPWRQIVDDPEAPAGPIAGVAAGLAVARTPLVAVLAVDLATPSAPLLRWLADAWDGRAPAVVPRADGYLQPLHAVYARTARGWMLERARVQGASLVTMLEPAAQIVEPEVWGPVADTDFARNLNTPDDARHAGAAFGQPSGRTSRS